MRTFEKEWGQLNGKSCKVVIRHMLFDKQQYECDSLRIINDENRIGVVIKGRELFIYKTDVVDFWVRDNIYYIKDKMTKIAIVNKM